MRYPILSLLVASLAAPAFAQDSVAATGNFYGASAGYSWFAPRGAHWGLITKRRFYLVDVAREWGVTPLPSAPVRFAWTLAMPLAAVQRTAASSRECWAWRGQPACTADSSVHMAVGIGVSPGFKLYWNRSRAVRPYLAGAVGTLLFGSDVPVNGAGRLSLTIEYGGGIMFNTRSGHAVTLGYKFHHLSNGTRPENSNPNIPDSGPLGTHPRANPGLDANVIYIGLLRRRV